ncbi:MULTISPECIES: alpha/beta fold hydrolase [Streptomyces]|uniref:alpha/beta fold hydrolase n=1 Tax=Streptomyces TaxID=1883 RepID=UPI00163CA631|nr:MULTISPECIES: alpha/beta fold hydrolase [Streptomyces]MBC2875506.1 alpha/beta fold hydrolase [Streptomyces sp. TYQ1024]UBI35744.1 alpha/beta fold hydrolase [Streptomyces mobaraensis]UKW28337.1 alpha/beta fold hydrolase [Streptomyces sp. TYQ1024]
MTPFRVIRSTPPARCRAGRGLRGPAAALCVVAAAVALACPAPAVRAAGADHVAVRPVMIPGEGGTPLRGSVAEPGGTGRHPLIVLARSWLVTESFYRRIQLTAAGRGYAVVVYAPRGHGGSGGGSGLAGPEDTADVSRVLDWSLAHTSGDAGHIGMLGVSYGAALSLLGAAADPRVKAVAALSGWTDLTDVLWSNGTPTPNGFGYVLNGALHGAGPRTAPLHGIQADDTRRLTAWAAPRSPATYLDRYNRRGTALFFADAWGDSMTAFGRKGEFFDRLRVPKRLEMRPGDHGGPEFTASLLPNEVADSAFRWFDRFLKGVANGVDTEPPVQVKPVNSGPLFGAGRPFEGYPSWAAMTRTTRRLYLGAGRGLREAPDGGSRTTLTAGFGTVADSGLIFLQRSLEAAVGVQVPRPLALVPGGTGAVWTSPPADAVWSVRGTPQLRLGVTPSASRGTLVAYLFDVNALGTGAFMTWAPYSFRGREPGREFTAGFALRPTAYDLPPGHRLGLVIGTADSQTLPRNRPLARLSVSSSPAAPSWVSVPLR